MGQSDGRAGGAGDREQAAVRERMEEASRRARERLKASGQLENELEAQRDIAERVRRHSVSSAA